MITNMWQKGAPAVLATLAAFLRAHAKQSRNGALPTPCFLFPPKISDPWKRRWNCTCQRCIHLRAFPVRGASPGFTRTKWAYPNPVHPVSQWQIRHSMRIQPNAFFLGDGSHSSNGIGRTFLPTADEDQKIVGRPWLPCKRSRTPKHDSALGIFHPGPGIYPTTQHACLDLRVRT